MGPRAWISSFVAIGLAGQAYGQSAGPPTASPPSADTTTAAGPAPVQATPNPPPPYPASPPPYPPPQPYPGPPPYPASPPPYPPPQPYPGPPPYVVAPQPPLEKPAHALCFSGRPFECASVLLLEIGARVGDGGRSVASADFGLLIHDGLNAYGATLGVAGISGGNAKDEANLWLAARYRRYLGSAGFASDVSIGYAGGPALEVAIGWADVVALTAGVNRYALEDGGYDTVAGVGLRIGSIIIGGLLYLTALVATSAR